MEKIEKIKLKTFISESGSLTPIELKDYIDWEVKRVYYLTDVSGSRGGHAVRGEKKMYICQKGEVKARLHDGDKWHEFELSGGEALIVRGACFRDFTDFSPDAILLAISSVNYEPDDYIYDLDDFISEVKS
ncbi:MAG: FdtA/QdtA family cupin domain-containing protein [Candidatus Peregrinibacteria bacterium]